MACRRTWETEIKYTDLYNNLNCNSRENGQEVRNLRDTGKWIRMKWDRYKGKDFGKVFLASLTKTVSLIHIGSYIGKVITEKEWIFVTRGELEALSSSSGWEVC